MRHRHSGHGRGGLTCSAVEMGAKGDLGVTLDLDKVPCREEGMSAYEMMLSESQERMLMVLKPEKEKEAEAIFRKWGLDFAVVGETTPTKRFIVRHGGDVMADLPIKELGDQAPEYKRPFVNAAKPDAIDAESVQAPVGHDRSAAEIAGDARSLLEALGVGAIRSRHSRQYRAAAGRRCRGGAHRGRAQRPCAHHRCDAALLRGRSVRGRQAGGGGMLAKSDRGRRAGHLPSPTISISAIPSGPEIMGQFVGCIRGIAEACKTLAFPVVSGNVSLYNETNGRAILPTPSIGGVGLIDDFTKSATLAFKRAGEAILLVGETTGWLGQSMYLRELCGQEEGAPPPVDLTEERENGDFVRALILDGTATAAHDLSDGGLLVGLAEMAMASGIGAKLDAAPSDIPVACPLVRRRPGALSRHGAAADKAAVSDAGEGCERAGVGNRETGGDTLTLAGERPILVTILRERFESWLPAYMAGEL